MARDAGETGDSGGPDDGGGSVDPDDGGGSVDPDDGGGSGSPDDADAPGAVEPRSLELTPDRVAAEHEWVRERADAVVPLVNEVRDELGEAFDTEVDAVDEADYRDAIDATFADGDRAVNVAALVAILRDLDVAGDYPGFVVDEWLGRELAATIAGEQPLRLLAEATFHFADIHHHTAGAAGSDDLDAALAAGVQTRLPGWDWTEDESPFGVET